MDFDRRQFLSEWLDIPPVLLGIRTVEEIRKLVEEKTGAQPATHPVASTASSTSSKHVVDVEEYNTLLNSYWTAFHSKAQNSIANALLRMDALYRALSSVKDKEPIYELLCRYHDFVTNALRDQRRYDDAILHLDKALWFAKLLNKAELIALVLWNYGYTLWEADRVHEALQKYEEAKAYERRLPSNLRGCLLLDTGRSGALVAKTKDAKREAIALVDRVGSIVRSNQKEEDPYCLNLNLDRYNLTRSASLIAVGRNEDAIAELKLVKVGSEYPRRQAYRDILEAQAYANLGEYEEASYLAESSFVLVQEANSEIGIVRVEKIYQDLKESPYKESADVARLDYLLRKRRKNRK